MYADVFEHSAWICRRGPSRAACGPTSRKTIFLEISSFRRELIAAWKRTGDSKFFCQYLGPRLESCMRRPCSTLLKNIFFGGLHEIVRIKS